MKMFKIFFVSLMMSFFFLPKAYCVGESLGIALGGSAEVLDNIDTPSEALAIVILKKNYEEVAELIGDYEKGTQALDGMPPEKIKAWWGDRMTAALKVFETGQQLLKAVEKTQEGDYGEATLRVLYAGAEALNNPLVKMIASSAIYTHKSYQALEATGVARDIEALYGKVDSDRRLLGEQDPNADGPKLIEINDENLQYFFDNYVDDNSPRDTQTRQLVKTYVKNRLNGTWPEAEWQRYVYLVGMYGLSSNPKHQEEIAEVGASFKKQVFKWLESLLQDVNAQAKLNWGQARLRQLTPQLQAYIQKLGGAVGRFQDMKGTFEQLENMKKNVPEWKRVLSESPAQLEKARKMLTEPKQIGQVQGLCNTWISKMRTATSGAHVVGEMALWESLKAEQGQWYEIEKQINAITERMQKDVAKDPALVYAAPAGEDISDEKKFYQENFAPLMKPFDKWEPSPEEAEAEMEARLNQGDFEGAEAVLAQWDKNQEIFQKYYDRDQGLPSIVKAHKDNMIIPIQDRLNEVSQDVAFYNKEDARLRRDSIHDSEQEREFIAVNQNRASAELLVKKLTDEIGFCNGVFSQFVDEVNLSLQNLTYAQWMVEKSKLDRMRDFVFRLRQSAEREWQQYLSSVIQVESQLPIKQLTNLENPQGSHHDKAVDEMVSLLEKAENDLAKIDVFVAGAPFDYVTSLASLYDQMGNRSYQVKGEKIDTEEVRRAMLNMEALFAEWKLAAESWKNLEKIAAEDLNRVRILVDREGADAYAKRKDTIEKSIILYPDLVAKIRSRAKDYLEAVDKVEGDREQDSFWLQSKLHEVQSFFNSQKEQKVIQSRNNDFLDYELVIPLEGEMAFVESPYRRYMMEQDFKDLVQTAENEWSTYAGFQFIQKFAPKVYQKFMDGLKPDTLKFAAEDNCIVRTPQSEVGSVIWQSDIAKFENAVNAVKYDATSIEFMQQIVTLTGVGGVPTFLKSSDTKSNYAVDESYAAFADDYNNPVGKRFIAALSVLKKTLSDRDKYLETSQGSTGSGPSSQPGAGQGMGPGSSQSGIGQGQQPGSGQPAGQGAPSEFAQQQGTMKQGAGPSQGVSPAGQSASQSPGSAEMPPLLQKERAPGNVSVGLSGYDLLNPRLNTVSLRDASGEVVLASSDLRQGAIEITARLSRIDQVLAVLFSEDDGRTWKELALSQDLAASFVPIPDKRYQPVIKIKTTDYQEKIFKLFESVSAIIYKDINYDDLIASTVKLIAEAYEMNNVSLFSDAISRDYLGNKISLVEGVRLDFDLFTSIRLTIYIDRIEKRQDTFVAETRWDKTQTPRSGGSEQRTSGKTTMVFALEDGKMKIKNLRGNLIYATLSPEIAQASGLPQTTVDEVRTAQLERNPVQPGAGETEQQSDGVTSSSTLSILHGSVRSAPPAPPHPGTNVHSFDFSAGAEGAYGAGDFNYLQYSPGGPNLTDQFTKNGVAAIREITSSTFESLDEAPATGYGDSFDDLIEGHVYVFKTNEGYYGKFKVTSIVNTIGVDDYIAFDYVVQTDGTTNIQSQ